MKTTQQINRLAIEHEGITAYLWFDDSDPESKIWFVEYWWLGRDLGDSFKWGFEHPTMPRRPEASKKAQAIVRKFLRHLAAQK